MNKTIQQHSTETLQRAKRIYETKLAKTQKGMRTSHLVLVRVVAKRIITDCESLLYRIDNELNKRK